MRVPRANDTDALAILLRRDRRQKVCYFAPMVGCNAFKAADGDGLAVLEAAAAGMQVSQGRSQVRPRIAGKHVRFAIQHVGVGKSAPAQSNG